MNTADGKEWYFAYGSNLCAERMRGAPVRLIRGMEGLVSRVCRVIESCSTCEAMTATFTPTSWNQETA